MKILAVDSSTSKASVALWSDGKILNEININDGKTHSEKLVPMIKEVFDRSDTAPQDADFFAVSEGPGSFTGLRIGIVTVKAMAMALGKKCVSVPTLDALAYNCKDFKGFICPVINARNNQVFTAVYKYGDKFPQKLTEYMPLHISELSDLIISLKDTENGSIIFCGDAALVHADFFKEQLKGCFECFTAENEKLLADAASVAYMADFMICEGKIIDSDLLVPNYLRKSSAEQMKEKKGREK